LAFLLLLLGLLGHEIFLYESPADGGLDKLGGGDWHSIELGPVGV